MKKGKIFDKGDISLNMVPEKKQRVGNKVPGENGKEY